MLFNPDAVVLTGSLQGTRLPLHAPPLIFQNSFILIFDVCTHSNCLHMISHPRVKQSRSTLEGLTT